MFNPRPEYRVENNVYKLIQFHRYPGKFITRPPYQRKSVWKRKEQQALLDSLFRKYYVPRLVMREVRIDDENIFHEVIDGQQRINTVQAFYKNQLKLPESLKDIRPDFPGKTIEELPDEFVEFFDELSFDVDIVTGIDKPTNEKHQEIATEIFWRLQQGEPLKYMEKAHARLSSLSRNFVVKYSDDILFDYDNYKSLDHNPHKHNFFNIISRSNNRMQHLALLARLLILEKNGGPTDLNKNDIMDFIDDYKQKEGVGDFSFEENNIARRVLSNLNLFYNVYKDDPLLDGNSKGLPIFGTEYFIISTYLLLTHLHQIYVLNEETKELFRDFIYELYDRLKAKKEEDHDIFVFSDNNRSSAAEIETRQRIMRQLFFEFANEQGVEIKTKDEKRAFSEAQRIKLYRESNGLCEECLAEDKPEKEAFVPWSNYEADHVLPHSKGGNTIVENGQVLCRRHNRMKGNRV